MGTFKEIKGDLIKLTKQGTFDLMAHGCNCQKMMGAGIAKQVKEHFPQAYHVDYLDTRAAICRLGDMTISSHRLVTPPSLLVSDETVPREDSLLATPCDWENVKILNLYTQNYGGKSFDLTALQLVLRKVNYLFPKKTIGLPLIGCGIAGGDWDLVKELIKVELYDMDVIIVHYSKNMVTELDREPKGFDLV